MLYFYVEYFGRGYNIETYYSYKMESGIKPGSRQHKALKNIISERTVLRFEDQVSNE